MNAARCQQQVLSYRTEPQGLRRFQLQQGSTTRAALAHSASVETDEDPGLGPDGGLGVDLRANVEEHVWSPEDGEDFWAAPPRKTECVVNERRHRN